MSQAKKLGTHLKFPDAHNKLVEMGFDSISVVAALDKAHGDLEGATVVLLEEPTNSINSSNQAKLATAQSNKPTKTPGIAQVKTTAVKPDIKEVHNKFMATYKTIKCKDKSNHDKRMCIYWHTKGDKRRNPFEVAYSCSECPNSTETTTCENGDACLKAHNMIERMFHPDLFKISMCIRGPNGAQCERGNLCAFAHSEEDHRQPPPTTKSTTHINGNTTITTSNNSINNNESIYSNKIVNDSKLLDDIQEKLITLIRYHGNDGIISSELPKRYYDQYNERLELTDEAGEKFRIKDLLLSHPNVTVIMHKGVQPKYVYEEEKATITTSTIGSNITATGGNSGNNKITKGISGIINPNEIHDTTNITTNISQDSPLDSNKDPIYDISNSPARISNNNDNSIVVASPKSSNSIFGTIDYSSAVTGGVIGGSRRRGPTDSNGNNSIVVNNSNNDSGNNLPNFNSLGILGTPSTNSSSNQSNVTNNTMNNENNALKQQITTLQNELSLKQREYELQTSLLRTVKHQLSEIQNNKPNVSTSITTNNNNAEVQKLRNETDVIKAKLLEKETEITTKSEEIRKREGLVQQLHQEKVADLQHFYQLIQQIETILVDIQVKESLYINEISLHDTINQSSRARDDLTKYVGMIKLQLLSKYNNETNKHYFNNSNGNINVNNVNNSVVNNVIVNNSPALVAQQSNDMTMLSHVSSNANNIMMNANPSTLLGSNLNNYSSHYALNVLPNAANNINNNITTSNSFGINNNNNIAGSSNNDSMLRIDDMTLGNNRSNLSLLNSNSNELENLANSLNRSNNSITNIRRCSLVGCMNEGSFTCGACGKAGYCGAEHQR